MQSYQFYSSPLEKLTPIHRHVNETKEKKTQVKLCYKICTLHCDENQFRNDSIQQTFLFSDFVGITQI